MYTPKVFFSPINETNLNNASQIAGKLLEKLVKENNIKLEKEIPIKIHTGQPGNISFIKPDKFKGMIDFLSGQNVKTYFTETCMVTGPRSKGNTHRQIVKDHGWTQIPFVLADGEDGEDHVEVVVKNGKHFKTAKIARALTNKKQILVVSHFKGHIAAGFGAAIKMLGIGFASRRGKIYVHCKDDLDRKTIDWSKNDSYINGPDFIERVAEYAQAAVNGNQYLYITFALNLVKDCDCDGVPMKPLYKDLGIFASTDPVAIDKACLDMLVKREGKKTYWGDEVFAYAEKIGLGTQKYELINIK